MDNNQSTTEMIPSSWLNVQPIDPENQLKVETEEVTGAVQTVIDTQSSLEVKVGEDLLRRMKLAGEEQSLKKTGEIISFLISL